MEMHDKNDDDVQSSSHHHHLIFLRVGFLNHVNTVTWNLP